MYKRQKELVASKVATDPDIGGDGVTDQSGTGGRFAIVTEAEELVPSPHGSVAVTTTSQSCPGSSLFEFTVSFPLRSETMKPSLNHE